MDDKTLFANIYAIYFKFHQGLLNAGLRLTLATIIVSALAGVMFHQGLLNAGLRL